jgi:hydrogenase nickel incorporation protein HypA/HybF
MAISQGLIELIEGQRREHGFARVERVVVELGALSHVEPEALGFCFDAAARGTVVEGAALDIETLPGRGYCMQCEKSVSVAARGEACPSCGSYQVLVQGGEEMRLKELEVA